MRVLQNFHIHQFFFLYGVCGAFSFSQSLLVKKSSEECLFLVVEGDEKKIQQLLRCPFEQNHD